MIENGEREGRERERERTVKDVNREMIENGERGKREREGGSRISIHTYIHTQACSHTYMHT